MPYPRQETWTFDLAEIGAPEMTVTMKDPRGLPAGRRRDYAKAQLTLLRMRQGVIPPREEAEAAMNVFDQLFGETCTAWTLPFPDDYPEVARRGEPIPLDLRVPTGATDAEGAPVTEVDPLYPVPSEAYDLIINKVVERLSSPPKSR